MKIKILSQELTNKKTGLEPGINKLIHDFRRSKHVVMAGPKKLQEDEDYEIGSKDGWAYVDIKDYNSGCDYVIRVSNTSD